MEVVVCETDWPVTSPPWVVVLVVVVVVSVPEAQAASEPATTMRAAADTAGMKVLRISLILMRLIYRPPEGVQPTANCTMTRLRIRMRCRNAVTLINRLFSNAGRYIDEDDEDDELDAEDSEEMSPWFIQLEHPARAAMAVNTTAALIRDLRMKQLPRWTTASLAGGRIMRRMS